MYGKGNKSCAKKREATYIMDVGKFALAYVAQKQIDYKLAGNDYGGADALDYVACTAVEYNDVYVSFRFGFVLILLQDCLCSIIYLFESISDLWNYENFSTMPNLDAPPKAV